MKREWLISSRKKRKLTQYDAASMIVISRSFYNQIESGERNPSSPVALRIANFYGFNMSKFYYLESCNNQYFREVN